VYALLSSSPTFFLVFGRVIMASTASQWALEVSWCLKLEVASFQLEKPFDNKRFRNIVTPLHFIELYGSDTGMTVDNVLALVIVQERPGFKPATLSGILHILRSKASLGKGKVLRMVSGRLGIDAFNRIAAMAPARTSR
jgi:hypothetical protein